MKNEAGKISVRKAILIGTLWVNGPVFTMLVGPLALLARLESQHVIAPEQKWIVVPVFLGGFVFAWLWWSFNVSRWRVWAFERVDDIPALKREAVQVGLTWHAGSVFNRTEIKSKEQAAKEQKLDQDAYKLDMDGLAPIRIKDVLAAVGQQARDTRRRVVEIRMSETMLKRLELDRDGNVFRGTPVKIYDTDGEDIVEVVLSAAE